MKLLLKAVIPEKRHVRTLTTGWRFTLPAQIRKERGWKAGTSLEAKIVNNSVILSESREKRNGINNHENTPPTSCYLGSGGKIVIPVEIRNAMPWVLGERLAIKDEPVGVVLTACCQKNRCRSCGALYGVQEVIENLFLCAKCRKQYLRNAVAASAK